METQSHVNRISSGLQNFVRLQAKSLQLKIYEQSSVTIVKITRWVIALCLGFVALIFLGAALALWLSSLLESYTLGFLITGLFFVLVLTIFWLVMRGDETLADKALSVVSSGSEKSFSQLRHKISHTENELSKQKKSLAEELKHLQEQLAGIENQFSGVGEAGGGNNTSKIIGNVAGFILQNVVLSKAGIVKRTVLPFVAKKILTSRFLREGKGAKWLRSLKSFFNRPASDGQGDKS